MPGIRALTEKCFRNSGRVVDKGFGKGQARQDSRQAGASESDCKGKGKKKGKLVKDHRSGETESRLVEEETNASAWRKVLICEEEPKSNYDSRKQARIPKRRWQAR